MRPYKRRGPADIAAACEACSRQAKASLPHKLPSPFLDLLAGLLQQGIDLPARHRWELLQKPVYAVSEFEMIEQGPRRYPRAGKARSSAENAFVDLNDFLHAIIISGLCRLWY